MSNLDSSGVRSGLRLFGRAFRFLFGCLFAALPLSADAQVVAPFLQVCIPGNTVDLSSNGCPCTANVECIGVCPVGSPGTRGCVGGPEILACAPIGNGLDLSANGCPCTGNLDCQGVCPVGNPGERFCVGGPGGDGPPPRRCDAPGNGLNLNLDGCPCNASSDCANACSLLTRTCGGLVGAIANEVTLITGNAVPQSAVLGDSVTANATVSGGIPMPARVIFDLHPPGDILCQAPIRTGSITLSAMGSISAPYAHTTTMAGSHRWRAEYAGNAWNLPDFSSCTALSMRVIVNAALFANGFE
jgi:hypothetical protein